VRVLGIENDLHQGVSFGQDNDSIDSDHLESMLVLIVTSIRLHLYDLLFNC